VSFCICDRLLVLLLQSIDFFVMPFYLRLEGHDGSLLDFFLVFARFEVVFQLRRQGKVKAYTGNK
jgi:hypothetical protein